MSLLVAHERESSPKSGETSPLKRTRSSSPSDLTTVISLKELEGITDAVEHNKKLLQRTMGDLYRLRESARFTYAAHYERNMMLTREADAKEDHTDPGVARLLARAAVSHGAGLKWHTLYDKATTLRNESLINKMDDETFNARLKELSEEEAECRKLPITDDDAYKIVTAVLNAHWYVGEKQKVTALGYDSSSMPDN